MGWNGQQWTTLFINRNFDFQSQLVNIQFTKTNSEKSINHERSISFLLFTSLVRSKSSYNFHPISDSSTSRSVLLHKLNVSGARGVLLHIVYCILLYTLNGWNENGPAVNCMLTARAFCLCLASTQETPGINYMFIKVQISLLVLCDALQTHSGGFWYFIDSCLECCWEAPE